MKRPRTLPNVKLSMRKLAAVCTTLVVTLTSFSKAWHLERIGTRQSSSSLFMHQRQNDLLFDGQSRRSFIRKFSSTLVAAQFMKPVAAQAVASPASTFTRQTDKFGYTFQPPSALAEGNKPLKTHLDEVNFFGPNGFQVGITIDPVRINSLAEFGSPSEVAAKVVLAEVNRDGVFDVKLMQDPVTKTQQSIEYVQLDYLSTGKRGAKRFVCKFMIHRNMLYALTAQCKQDDYDTLSSELLQAVESFQVIV